MSDDLEIIEDNDNESILLNLLSKDENDSDDDDIICLDTVFKPKRKDTPTDERDSTTFSKVSSIGPSSSSANQFEVSNESSLINDLEREEVLIDEIIDSPLNLKQSVNNVINEQSVNNVINEQSVNNGINEKRSLEYFNKEKPKKKPKLQKSNSPCSKNLAATSSTTANISKEKRKENFQCAYPVPPVSVHSIIVLIMKNEKCLLYKELWDYISGMFPYFECCFTPQQGFTKIRRIIRVYKSYFMESSTSAAGKSNRKLIMLNPMMHSEKNLIVDIIVKKKDKFLHSMYSPELFDSLVDGTLNLSSVTLYHDRKVRELPFNLNYEPPAPLSTDWTRESELFTTGTFSMITTCAAAAAASSSSSDGASHSVASPASEGTSKVKRKEGSTSSMYEMSLKDVNVLELVNEEERAEALSPKSNSSTETVVFDPKIVNCRSLNDEESNMLSLNDLEETNSSILPPNSINQGDQQNDFLKGFENVGFNPINLNSEGAFINTVWSNDIALASNPSSAESVVNRTEDSQTPIQSFPEIDKCIPKWREIFPWMEWDPRKKTISCSLCQNTHKKLNPKNTVSVLVVEIFHPDHVFKVSKMMRAHSEKYHHKMAHVLANKSFVTILHYLLNLHFSEFSSVNEIINVFESFLGNNANFNQDILKCVIQMMGEYLEDRLISKLTKLKKFSVITDPCAGLLIVRFLNENDDPEEHIITSYSRVINKTPCDYLASLGVSTKGIVAYVSNSRCEECHRCKATKKERGYKQTTPLRLPQIDKYLLYLWKTKLLKPFYSIGTSLCKLWMSFPHLFCEVGKFVPLQKLSKFLSKPDVFLDLFQHFDKFKQIALSIYKLAGNLEALGFQSIDVKQYEWLLEAFPILTNINILLIEIKTVFPFHKDFDNLFHITEKFKFFCDKIKVTVKEKKLRNLSVDIGDIDDLYNVVEITVKEFQQPIYYKGKSVSLAYQRITTLRNLEAYTTNDSVQHTYIVLFSTIKSSFGYDKVTLLDSLTRFLKENKNCDKKDAHSVLKHFRNKKIPRHHMSDFMVYSFYRIMAFYPFLPAKHEKNIYEMKIFQYHFYRSAWTGVGPNIKEHLMTIMYELYGKQLLSERDIISWWRERGK